MITYAILSSNRDTPWGYYQCPHDPTLEELADAMAQATGYPDRDAWLRANGVTLLGFAPVH